MLAWFFERVCSWTERQNMSKTAAEAAVSTECGFANGASELVWKRTENSGGSRGKHGVRFCEWHV